MRKNLHGYGVLLMRMLNFQPALIELHFTRMLSLGEGAQIRRTLTNGRTLISERERTKQRREKINAENIKYCFKYFFSTLG